RRQALASSGDPLCRAGEHPTGPQDERTDLVALLYFAPVQQRWVPFPSKVYRPSTCDRSSRAPVAHSRRIVPIRRLQKAFACGACTGVLSTCCPIDVIARSNACRIDSIPVMKDEPV